MSAQQKPAERDSVGKALARTANPAHAASLLRRAFACLRTRGWQALWREIFYRPVSYTHLTLPTILLV